VHYLSPPVVSFERGSGLITLFPGCRYILVFDLTVVTYSSYHSEHRERLSSSGQENPKLKSLTRKMDFWDSVKSNPKIWITASIAWVVSCVALERMQVRALASAKAQEARLRRLGASSSTEEQCKKL
jgi:hypothetical protein